MKALSVEIHGFKVPPLVSKYVPFVNYYYPHQALFFCMPGYLDCLVHVLDCLFVFTKSPADLAKAAVGVCLYFLILNCISELHSLLVVVY